MDLTGVDNCQIGNLKMVSCCGTMSTPNDKFIAVFDKHAFMPDSKTIQSSL